MNGIATITIDGQKVRLKFGLPAVRRIFEKMAEHQLVISRDGTDQYNDLGIAHVLYAGYLNGCMQRDEQPTLPFELFYDIVENFAAGEHDRNEIIAAVRSFEESRFVKPLAQKVGEEGEESKKKDIEWDDIEAFVYGELGFKPADFYRLTWREYVLARRGHNIRRSHEFEHTRAIVYHNIAINRDPKKPFPTIEKFWPLPTDGDIDQQEEDESKKLWDKLQKFKKEKLHK